MLSRPLLWLRGGQTYILTLIIYLVRTSKLDSPISTIKGPLTSKIDGAIMGLFLKSKDDILDYSKIDMINS